MVVIGKNKVEYVKAEKKAEPKTAEKKKGGKK